MSHDLVATTLPGLQNILAKFSFVTGNETERRKLEQFVLNQLRNALGLTENALKNTTGGVENKINPVNASIRAFIKNNVGFCSGI